MNKIANMLRLAADRLEGKTEEATKLAEARMQDGTVLYSTGEEFVEGGDIFTVSPEGDRVPLASGTYELESGAVITVEQEGVIASVQMPETPEVEVEVEAAKNDKDKEKNMLAELVERISALEASSQKLAAVESELKATKEELAEQKQHMELAASSIEKLSARATNSVLKERESVDLSEEVIDTKNLTAEQIKERKILALQRQYQNQKVKS